MQWVQGGFSSETSGALKLHSLQPASFPQLCLSKKPPNFKSCFHLLSYLSCHKHLECCFRAHCGVALSWQWRPTQPNTEVPEFEKSGSPQQHLHEGQPLLWAHPAHPQDGLPTKALLLHLTEHDSSCGKWQLGQRGDDLPAWQQEHFETQMPYIPLILWVREAFDCIAY